LHTKTRILLAVMHMLPLGNIMMEVRRSNGPVFAFTQ